LFLSLALDVRGEPVVSQVTHGRVQHLFIVLHTLHHVVLHGLGHFVDGRVQFIFLGLDLLALSFEHGNDAVFLLVQLLAFPGLAFGLDEVFHSLFFFFFLDLLSLLDTFLLGYHFRSIFNVIFQLDGHLPLGHGLVTLFLKDSLFDVVDLVLDHEFFVGVVFVGDLLVEAGSSLGSFAESDSPGREDVELSLGGDLGVLADLDIAVVEGLDGLSPVVHLLLALGTDGG